MDDTIATRAAPYTRVAFRAGWGGVVGVAPVHPYVAAENLFGRRSVGPVVINAARGRYYEPALGRTLPLGLSLGLSLALGS